MFNRFTSISFTTIFCFLFLTIFHSVLALESDYQQMLCKGMEQEVRTKSGIRADSVNSKYAIEVEFSDKWKNAIGQSLAYAKDLNKKAAVILICKNERTCTKHAILNSELIKDDKLPISVWYCPKDAGALSDCVFEK